jgi:hypothetical protein
MSLPKAMICPASYLGRVPSECVAGKKRNKTMMITGHSHWEGRKEGRREGRSKGKVCSPSLIGAAASSSSSSSHREVVYVRCLCLLDMVSKQAFLDSCNSQQLSFNVIWIESCDQLLPPSPAITAGTSHYASSRLHNMSQTTPACTTASRVMWITHPSTNRFQNC